MSDPIMTPREYLTLPKNQAEVFLKLWVERQPDQSRAASQAQGLRLKAALAVADGTEQNHPPEIQAPHGEDKADYDDGDLGPRETHEEDEYSEFPGLSAFIKQCGEPCKMVMEPEVAPRWEKQVDPWGRTFSQAWKEFGEGIERENDRVRALNAADEVVKRELSSADWRRAILERNQVTPKMDLLGSRK